MTSESPEKTVPWCEELGVKYAYGYLKSGNLMQQLGCKGYPSAALIDPKGIVVWQGHPSRINGSLISKHLRGADRTPVAVRAVSKNWPASAKPVKAALMKDNLKAALAAANRLSNDPAGPQIVEDVQGLVTRRVARVEAKNASGDYLGAIEEASAIKKSLSGLPEAKTVDALVKGIKSDREKKAVVKAQKSLAKLKGQIYEARKKKDLDPIAKKLEKIEAKHAENHAGEQARGLLAKLADKRKSMPR